MSATKSTRPDTHHRPAGGTDPTNATDPAASSPAASTRIDVAAADGTPIAVWVTGDGPALVMVHGSIADHTTFDSFVAVLARHLTTYAMDRRGFGGTPDAAEYTIDVDFADVAAVVDAVAAHSGGPVAVWGHSYGANCAMGGAARSGNVSHLVLYEPSLGLGYPPGSIERIEAALARGDHDAAIVAVLVDALEMTDAEVAALRDDPLWPVRLAAAPTIARECRVEEQWEYQPGQFDTITAPTLLLTGDRSVPAVAQATVDAAAAIQGARVHALHGHGHFAHKTDPELVVAVVRDFISR